MPIVLKSFLALLLLSAAYCKLIFQDNFNKFNFRKWKHEVTLSGGGNWEFQIYQNNRTTSFVKNGKLHLKPVLTDNKIGPAGVRTGSTYDIWGGYPHQCTSNAFYGCSRASDGNHYINPVTSAKIMTVDSFSFTYGRMEVRAKLPKGDWLWPAIWLLPRYNEYGTWPASGEIDIMESRGNVGYPKEFGGGPESFGSTLHWGPDWSVNQFMKTHAEKSIQKGTLADGFHTYGLYWDENILYTYLDDDSNRVLVVKHGDHSYWQKADLDGRANPWSTSDSKCAPFDKDFYIILNLAVGGTNGYFRDGIGSKPWADHSHRASSDFYDNKGQWLPSWGDHSTFQIDSVKVWDLDEDEDL